MLFIESITGPDVVFSLTGSRRRLWALPGAFRSRQDLMHHASSLAALLSGNEAGIKEILLTEFQFGRGDSGLWVDLSKEIAPLLRDGDIVFADSMAGGLLALLPENIREGLAVILRRPPIVGSARRDPNGAVQKIYASWLRKINAGEYDRVFQSILPENPDYPGGSGLIPSEAVLPKIILDFGASNLELSGRPPENWLILEGGQDTSFHPVEALRDWENWGMSVFHDLPSAVAALKLS